MFNGHALPAPPAPPQVIILYSARTPPLLSISDERMVLKPCLSAYVSRSSGYENHTFGCDYSSWRNASSRTAQEGHEATNACQAIALLNQPANFATCDVRAPVRGLNHLVYHVQDPLFTNVAWEPHIIVRIVTIGDDACA